MKKLDKKDLLIRHLLKEVGFEKPSPDFTSELMKKVYLEKTYTQSKELIGKPILAGLYGFLLISGIGISVMGSESLLDFKLFNSHIFFLSELDFSHTALYTLSFMFLFFLQICFLKFQIDKRFDNFITD